MPAARRWCSSTVASSPSSRDSTGCPADAVRWLASDALAAGNAVRIAELGSDVDLVTSIRSPPSPPRSSKTAPSSRCRAGAGGREADPDPLLLDRRAGGRGSRCCRLPRTLIVAGEHSQATVVESYAALGGADLYLSCGVTEIVAADGRARRPLQGPAREPAGVPHGAAAGGARTGLPAVLARAVSLGAALARHDFAASLAGEGADANLNGLYLVRGRQHCDTHMRVDHAPPHCGSHELYKGMLDGTCAGGLQRPDPRPPGRAEDRRQADQPQPPAVGRRAGQHQPAARIFADDVKCTHGSTVGQLDADAVFYLRSRGIGGEAAKSLLTYAFASDLVERVAVRAAAPRARGVPLPLAAAGRRRGAGGLTEVRMAPSRRPRRRAGRGGRRQPLSRPTSSAGAPSSRAPPAGPRPAAGLPRQRRDDAEAASRCSRPMRGFYGARAAERAPRRARALASAATAAYEGARETVRAVPRRRAHGRDRLRARHHRGDEPGGPELRAAAAAGRRRGPGHRARAPLEHRSLAAGLRRARRAPGASRRSTTRRADRRGVRAPARPSARGSPRSAHVSNALGTINPVREMVGAGARGAACRCSSTARRRRRTSRSTSRALGCDFYAFSGHKVFGPTGIGALYGRQRATWRRCRPGRAAAA